MRLAAMAMMLMATTCCFASETAYELSLVFSVDGKQVASPQVVVTNDVKKTIDLDGRFIDVLAHGGTDGKRIELSFWIGEVDGGERKIVATPAIVVLAGRQAVVTVNLDDHASGMKQVSLAVTAISSPHL
jgi:hypothetical protein